MTPRVRDEGTGEDEEKRGGGKREMVKREAGRENERARPRVGQGRLVSAREFPCEGWMERKRERQRE